MRFTPRLTTRRGVRFTCLVFCLDLELIHGVPGLQGTDKVYNLSIIMPICYKATTQFVTTQSSIENSLPYL
jgi:hypothetical protein